MNSVKAGLPIGRLRQGVPVQTKILLSLMAFCACAVPAGAAIDCTGTVTNLSLQMGTAGTVTLSLSGGPTYTYLCNVGEGNLNGVSPSVCKTMYATLLTAKAANKQMLMRFYDYDSCASVPSWGNAGNLGWTKVLLD